MNTTLQNECLPTHESQIAQLADVGLRHVNDFLWTGGRRVHEWLEAKEHLTRLVEPSNALLRPDAGARSNALQCAQPFLRFQISSSGRVGMIPLVTFCIHRARAGGAHGEAEELSYENVGRKP